MTSIFQPRFSAKREYMRKRSEAKRAASSPPVPARISTMAGLSASSSRGRDEVLELGLERRAALLELPRLLAGELAHLGVGLVLDDGLGALERGEDRLVLRVASSTTARRERSRMASR